MQAFLVLRQTCAGYLLYREQRGAMRDSAGSLSAPPASSIFSAAPFAPVRFDLVHPALTALIAVAGGPLPLRRAEAESGADEKQTAQFEFARPHFTAVVRLDAADGFSIGEMARVKFQSTRTVTLWSEAQRAVDR